MRKNEALKKARELSGLSQEELAEKMSVSQSYIAALEKNKNFSVKKAIEIGNYLGIDGRELIFAKEDSAGYNKVIEGKKTRFEANPIHIASDPNDYDNDGSRFEEMGDGTLRMRVPVIPHRAYAGYLRGFQDEQFYEDLDTISIDVFKQHKGNYMAFEVMGDSMTTLEPEHFKESIFEGSIAVGRELSKHQWQYKLHTHNYDAWVIVHKTEGILIKQIISHDVENGYIRIHSLNPDKELYPDEDLFLDDIEQIFNVVQIVLRK